MIHVVIINQTTPPAVWKQSFDFSKNSAVGMAELAGDESSDIHKFLPQNKAYVFQNSLRRNFEKMPPVVAWRH